MRIAPSLTPPDMAGAKPPCEGFGIASLDRAFGGGLSPGRVHEVYAAEPDDAAAAIGFAMALASVLTKEGQHSVLWLRSRRAMRLGGVLQAQGWAELGGVPGMALLGVVPDETALLRAAVDALRCPALSMVVAESCGTMRELDLTTSRRLALTAEKSGVPLLLLRLGAKPVPSAAQTRWQVTSAPSKALASHAPGAPVFDITLLRQKSGPCGMNWRLEWDRDRRIFREATLSGDMVSVPASRSAAVGTGGQYSGASRSVA